MPADSKPQSPHSFQVSQPLRLSSPHFDIHRLQNEVKGRAPRLYETGMTNRSQEADRAGGVRHLCSDGVVGGIKARVSGQSSRSSTTPSSDRTYEGLVGGGRYN